MTKFIRAVIFLEEGIWVAHCLEHDIGAQAPTIELLLENLELTIQADYDIAKKDGKSLDSIEKAPEIFFERWRDRKDKGGDPVKEISFVCGEEGIILQTLIVEPLA